MTAAERWLRARVGRTSPQLLELMIAALPADATDVGEALAEGAVRIYRQVLAGDGSRADALPLLAADALFTHAFEARAESDPGSLDGFARDWGGSGKIAGVLK